MTLSGRSIRGAFVALGLAIAIGLAAGFQVLGLSRDYPNYVDFFRWLQTVTWAEAFSRRFEPGFIALSMILVQLSLPIPIVYAVLAGSSVFLKLLSIRSSPRFWFTLSVFLYFFLTRYLALFEMTVLRGAMAASIGFMVFAGRTTLPLRMHHIGWLIVASLLHYSAVVLIPLYMIGKISRTLVVAASIAAFAVSFAAVDAVFAIAAQSIPVFGTYVDLQPAAILPVTFSLDLVLFVAALLMWKGSDLVMRASILALGVSIGLHFGMLDYSLFAARFRELLSVFCLLYVVRAVGNAPMQHRVLAVSYALMSGCVWAYATFIHDPLLT